MSAVTVPNTLPPHFVALSQEIIEQKDDLIDRAAAMCVTNAEEARAADAIVKRISALHGQVEEQRLAFGRELRTLQDQINVAASEALQPLADIREHLGRQIRAFELADRARIAVEEAKAEEERKVRQAEEDQRAQEAAEFAAEPGQAPSEVAVPEAMPRQVPAPYVPPAYKSSSVRAKPKRLDVFDPALVPFELNGIRLHKELNLTAIKALIASGIVVPGCRMAEDDGIALKGAR